MEKEKLVIADTDVIIEFLDRDNEVVKQKLRSFGINNIFLSEVTASELVFGARDKKHLATLIAFVDQCVVLPINEATSNLHFKLVRDYSLSHKLQVQDALIAATALHWDIDLFTLNLKDFKFIKGLRLL
jgi:tRNA(fMet)-specific endonuclease VapC